MVDQLGGGLLADPGHAREVVARVAAQRRVLGVLRRRDARALEDPGLVVERVVGDAAAVVEHLDVRVGHQLVAVAVAGDDDHVDAVGRGARRERRDRRRRPRRPTPAASGCAACRPPRGSAGSAARRCRASPCGCPCSRRRARGGTCGPGASNTTAMPSGCSSPSTFTSIDVNPNTAFVIVPSGVARSVGSA